MATWNVTTPVAGYTGTVVGVHFKDGAGQVDGAVNPAAVEYFRRNGYGLTEAEPVSAVEDTAPDTTEPEPEAEPEPVKPSTRNNRAKNAAQ